MSERKPAPAKTGRHDEESMKRERRLGEALRANLGRRKAQARAREHELPPRKEG